MFIVFEYMHHQIGKWNSSEHFHVPTTKKRASVRFLNSQIYQGGTTQHMWLFKISNDFNIWDRFTLSASHPPTLPPHRINKKKTSQEKWCSKLLHLSRQWEIWWKLNGTGTSWWDETNSKLIKKKEKNFHSHQHSVFLIFLTFSLLPLRYGDDGKLE